MGPADGPAVSLGTPVPASADSTTVFESVGDAADRVLMILTVQDGVTGDAREYELRPHGVYKIGRSSFNDIVLSAPNVSRRHACIRTDGAGAWLEDLGSSNRTYLKGQVLKDKRRLEDGDSFEICGIRLVVSVPEGHMRE